MSGTMNAGGPREALVNITMQCLRAEAGIREAQGRNRPTGYYAGRRKAFARSAAILAHYSYGTDMEAAELTILNEVTKAGNERQLSALRMGSEAGPLATEIAGLALLAEA